MTFTTLPASSRVKVGEKYVGEGERVYFIAEIGNNHNGDYYLAKRTIEQAAQAGADAVKFQKRFIDEVFTKEMQDRPQTKDQVLGKTYGEYRRALELNQDEFAKLKEYATEVGINFFATPFDKKSVDFLEEVGVDVYKIASFDVTNTPLLEYVARKGKPIFLSAGMCSIGEVDGAVETILRHNNQLILKHCVSVYPTPDEKENLRTIPFLAERYRPIPIGYSGHEQDILPTLAAITLGAKSVERHFTLHKALPGPDHATVSITPEEFKTMVDDARRIEKVFGTPRREPWEEEMRAREKHSKSIVSRVAIPAGTILAADMLTCKSPGHGLKPYRLPEVIGRATKVDLAADTVITEADILW